MKLEKNHPLRKFKKAINGCPTGCRSSYPINRTQIISSKGEEQQINSKSLQSVRSRFELFLGFEVLFLRIATPLGKVRQIKARVKIRKTKASHSQLYFASRKLRSLAPTITTTGRHCKPRNHHSWWFLKRNEATRVFPSLSSLWPTSF